MYQHFILTYSSFDYGKRIAFHKVYDSYDGIFEFLDISDKIKEKFSNINFGFHHIQTNQKTWKSIKDYDMFFSDIEEIQNENEFEKLLLSDITVKPLDIAKLILSKKKCSQLEVQKLVYFCACEYLKKYNEHLFEKENFEAWSYGPVISSLYHKLKKYERESITINKNFDTNVCIYSRMIKFKNYKEIIDIVDKTLEKYQNYSSSELVEESHIKDGPWYKVFNNHNKNEIPKNILEEFYCS